MICEVLIRLHVRILNIKQYSHAYPEGHCLWFHLPPNMVGSTEREERSMGRGFFFTVY